mgnify:CR=1 FL=1
MIRKILLSLSFIIISKCASAQYTYGTTGLLNMPTADMQKDGTFMFGGGYLEKHASPARWFYDTYNYYINITLFPWLEISYHCILHKSVKEDYGTGSDSYWVPSTFGRFVNQDRQFNVRIRIWEEGRWKSWTPQLVFGSDDVSSHSWGDTDRRFEIANNYTNGFGNRYYLAATKHFELDKIGILGIHAAYLYNKRLDYPLNGISIGTNFQFSLPNKELIINRLLNELNIMLEAYPIDGRGTYHVNTFYGAIHYDRGVHIGKYDINIGACYSLWKDRINLYGELYGCKDFSGGIQFKVHLK